MFVTVVKVIPRAIISLLAAVMLSLVAFAVAAASFVGISMAVQGWAANPPTTINAPVQR